MPRIAGPVFGWNLDCTIDFSDAEASPEETCESLLGGGLDVSVMPGRGALTLDLRSTLGLDEVIRTESGTDLEIRNRTFTAMLGYSLGF